MVQDPLISADWLVANIEHSDVRVLDATWVPPFLKDRPTGKACFADGHILGAEYFDIDQIADRETTLSHMLPSASVFAEKVGGLGVSNDTHVIVYDSNGFFASARAWWMFRAMGHTQVQVLDGGLEAWRQAGGKVDTGTTQAAQPAVFNATLASDLVRDISAMRRHVAKGDVKILDARDQGRFNGTSPEPRASLASGHMPGSFCVPASVLLTDEKKMKPAADLSPLLSNFVDSPVITSCGSGVSAAVIALALARLGNWDAALYDGSWSEWAAHPDNPIATTP